MIRRLLVMEGGEQSTRRDEGGGWLGKKERRRETARGSTHENSCAVVSLGESVCVCECCGAVGVCGGVVCCFLFEKEARSILLREFLRVG